MLDDETRDAFFVALLSVAKTPARKLIAQHDMCSEDIAAEVEATIAEARNARAASRKTQANNTPTPQA